jgi:hypothetical protein
LKQVFAVVNYGTLYQTNYASVRPQKTTFFSWIFTPFILFAIGNAQLAREKIKPGKATTATPYYSI